MQVIALSSLRKGEVTPPKSYSNVIKDRESDSSDNMDKIPRRDTLVAKSDTKRNKTKYNPHSDSKFVSDNN